MQNFFHESNAVHCLDKKWVLINTESGNPFLLHYTCYFGTNSSRNMSYLQLLLRAIVFMRWIRYAMVFVPWAPSSRTVLWCLEVNQMIIYLPMCKIFTQKKQYAFVAVMLICVSVSGEICYEHHKCNN